MSEWWVSYIRIFVIRSLEEVIVFLLGRSLSVKEGVVALPVPKGNKNRLCGHQQLEYNLGHLILKSYGR
jgi:hypothetical protein